jgi:hypothetical protein
MKNELMEVAASVHARDRVDVALQCQVLGLLLNSSTSTFCFPSSLNADTSLEATLLTQRLVAENPPDLRCMVIKDAEDETSGMSVLSLKQSWGCSSTWMNWDLKTLCVKILT